MFTLYKKGCIYNLSFDHFDRIVSFITCQLPPFWSRLIWISNSRQMFEPKRNFLYILWKMIFIRIGWKNVDNSKWALKHNLSHQTKEREKHLHLSLTKWLFLPPSSSLYFYLFDETTRGNSTCYHGNWCCQMVITKPRVSPSCLAAFCLHSPGLYTLLRSLVCQRLCHSSV